MEEIYQDTMRANWRTRVDRYLAWMTWWVWLKSVYLRPDNTAPITPDEEEKYVTYIREMAQCSLDILSNDYDMAIESNVFTTLGSLFETIAILLQSHAFSTSEQHGAFRKTFMKSAEMWTTEFTERMELFAYVIQCVQTIQETLNRRFPPGSFADTRIAAERIFFMGQFMMAADKNKSETAILVNINQARSISQSDDVLLYLSTLDMYDKLIVPPTAPEILAIDPLREVLPTAVAATTQAPYSPRRNSFSDGTLSPRSVGHHRRPSNAVPPTATTTLSPITDTDAVRLKDAIKSAERTHKKSGKGVIVNMTLDDAGTEVSASPPTQSFLKPPPTTETLKIQNIDVSSSMLSREQRAVLISSPTTASIYDQLKSGQKKSHSKHRLSPEEQARRAESRMSYSWVNDSHAIVNAFTQNREASTPNGHGRTQPTSRSRADSRSSAGWQAARTPGSPISSTNSTGSLPVMTAMLETPQPPMSSFEIMYHAKELAKEAWDYVRRSERPLLGMNAFVTVFTTRTIPSKLHDMFKSIDELISKALNEDMRQNTIILAQCVDIAVVLVQTSLSNMDDLAHKMLLQKQVGGIHFTTEQLQDMRAKAQMIAILASFIFQLKKIIQQVEYSVLIQIDQEVDDHERNTAEGTLSVLQQMNVHLIKHLTTLKEEFKLVPKIPTINTMTGAVTYVTKRGDTPTSPLINDKFSPRGPSPSGSDVSSPREPQLALRSPRDVEANV